MPNSNKVVLENTVHHKVKTPFKSAPRILVVSTGTCNSKPFEAILHNDVGLGSSAKLYHCHDVSFDMSEYQSIRRKMKTITPNETFDHREDEPPEGYESFAYFLYVTMDEKHYGKKIYLSVPFSEKEDAKSLGGHWDSNEKKWYVHDKNPNLGEFEKWRINTN